MVRVSQGKDFTKGRFSLKVSCISQGKFSLKVHDILMQDRFPRND